MRRNASRPSPAARSIISFETPLSSSDEAIFEESTSPKENAPCSGFNRPIWLSHLTRSSGHPASSAIIGGRIRLGHPGIVDTAMN